MIPAAELARLCQVYGELLGLGDWRLSARYARRREEINPGSVGQLNWQRHPAKQAEVLIHPGAGHDHEVTFVHELIHIPLLECPPKSRREERLQERAIDTYARALVRASRGEANRTGSLPAAPDPSPQS